MTDSIDSDLNLFKQVLAGDSDATDQFARKYSQEVFAYCFRRLYHREKAEDAAQETFMKFWKSIRTIREPQKFRGFLYRIAHHCCIDILRDPRNNPQEPDGNESGSDQKSPEDMVAEKEIIAIIQNILEDFKENQKNAIILIHFQKLKYKEVSEILDIPEGAVKSSVNRGMLKLSKILKKRGIVQ